VNTNRSKLARERAGLTIGQAARLLNMPSGDLLGIEERDSDFDATDQMKLAALYQVRIEWLTGDAELRDYASVDKIDGADKLSFHDRDIIAEFAASIPRRATRKCITCGSDFALPSPPETNAGRATYLCAGCR
jgi:hypothetical protein